jgi:hypothetical protein
MDFVPIIFTASDGMGEQLQRQQVEYWNSGTRNGKPGKEWKRSL